MRPSRTASTMVSRARSTGLVGRTPGLSGEAGGEHHAPRRPRPFGLRDQGVEVGDVLRRLVDAHQRRQRAPAARPEAFELLGRRVVRQFCEGEDEQQTLRFGLRGGGGQELPEMRGVVHGEQGRAPRPSLSCAGAIRLARPPNVSARRVKLRPRRPAMPRLVHARRLRHRAASARPLSRQSRRDGKCT